MIFSDLFFDSSFFVALISYCVRPNKPFNLISILYSLFSDCFFATLVFGILEIDEEPSCMLAIITPLLLQVERLEEAIAEASKKDELKNSRKRNRDSSDDTDESNKLPAISEFRGMLVKELREEAIKRGLDSTGTKKELLERLCNDSDNNSVAPVKSGTDRAKDDNNGFEEEEREEKIVTATKKGAAVLDQWIPDAIKNQYHVLQRGDDVYDAILNQTNVRDNNNKFFVLQVLESDDKKTYMFYTRWGRVGVKGQNKLDGPYSCDFAIGLFSDKFCVKTKNYWYDRKNFIPHPKSYTWLEMDYGKEEKPVNDIPSSSSEVKPENSKLDTRVAKFISLICNVSMMTQHMMEIGKNWARCICFFCRLR